MLNLLPVSVRRLLKKTINEKKFLKMPNSLIFEEPIRDDIFSPERLEQYAEFLSLQLTISKVKKRGQSLLPRFEDNYRCLTDAYTKLTASINRGFSVSPAGEWFVDNFHIIEEQVREVRVDLPEAFYRELPKVSTGELKGYPQVYAIALALVAHQDSHIDIESVKRFLQKYQLNKPLVIGEIWAIAIALRLVLIENLRRLALQIIHFQDVLEWADDCADKILLASNNSKDEILKVRDELIFELEKVDSADCYIIVQLTKRLRDQSTSITPISESLNKHINNLNSNFDEILHIEYKRQAEAQVTVSNIVNSMRLLSTVDWNEFFEQVNLIDPILKNDPSNAYDSMDFKSRDRYRHEIERIFKNSKKSEIEIACTVLALARGKCEDEASDERKSHVGYYLVDKGLDQLEKSAGYRYTIVDLLKKIILKYSGQAYFSLLTLLILILLVPIILYSFRSSSSYMLVALISLVSIIPISESCLNIINIVFSHILKPRVLPKIDLQKNLHISEKVFVVIPTILADLNAASKMLDGLEMRFLANQEKNFLFALLSDFKDADTESVPGDEELLSFLVNGIDTLNLKYSNGIKKFYLFHRKRLWNQSEHKWIGWERKRGKIHEFNSFLRGKENTSFVYSPPYESSFLKINYVITLDSDTQLPRGSASKLLGTILHPLNKPRFSKRLGRVVRGYGVLQPRISITPESSKRSMFATIFSGQTGVDPYTTAVSDVYQDLFGEGIYTGKGLYHIDCFEQALEQKVPENSLLSHDLFEGLFGRVALVSEVEFLDEYPSQYEAYSRRLHRWTRGDWQILPWLLPKVYQNKSSNFKNTLPLISKWKIFDNLRRSLVTPFVLLWLILGWCFQTGSSFLWTTVILSTLFLPHAFQVFCNLCFKSNTTSFRAHLWNNWLNIKTNVKQFSITILCIPHLGYIKSDAILRTIFRLYISKKNLLNWQTAEDVESRLKGQKGLDLSTILISALISTLLFVLIYFLNPSSLLYASPFLLCWFSFPLIIKKLSVVHSKKRVSLNQTEEDLIRNISRKTWNFFESIVTKEDNWLAPDNFQEDPVPLIAHRTSPTNLGLLLLTNCSAKNLGYISLSDMFLRLDRSINSMLKLERCFGHFYNWYDTQSLLPLDPKYISTVDSGNLAGHLIAVKQSCLSAIDSPMVAIKPFSGLYDTLVIIQEKLNLLDLEKNDGLNKSKMLIQEKISLCKNLCLKDVDQSILEYKNTLNEMRCCLDDVKKELEQGFTGQILKVALYWLDSSLKMIRSFIISIDDVIINIKGNDLESLTSLLEKNNLEIYSDWKQAIDEIFTNKSLKSHEGLLSKLLKLLGSVSINDQDIKIVQKIKAEFERVSVNCLASVLKAKRLAQQCDILIKEMNFKVLYHQHRKLFSIGFNVEHGCLDNSFYDLLASESRLASFVAIAKGDIPQDHWFHLGRQMTTVYKERVLVSWSASMFEYLMPLLVMKSYANTLLSETENAVIKQQIIYCKIKGVPWGISESAYNARDLQMNYQYGPFGVPGIGLKRGLGNDTVISPYSTALASLVSSQDASRNFKRLEREGILTDYGFYESIDYTKKRLQSGQNQAVIKSFMVHHQGMVMTSLDNLLNDNVLQKRFHEDLMVRTSELLLQERIPAGVDITHPRAEEVHFDKEVLIDSQPSLRHINIVDTLYPITQVLSNGNYSVVVSAKGSGFSKSNDILLSRWCDDPFHESLGNYIFIRDDSISSSWSTSFAPCLRDPKAYKTIFSEHKAEFWCHKNEIASHVEIIVSSKDDIELKQLTLVNHSNTERTLSLTSYLEPILTTKAADIAHRAFSDLFIETEYIASKMALIAKRRRRSNDDNDLWAIHLVNCKADQIQDVEHETCRKKFIGRSNNISSASSLTGGLPLTNTTGAVLDPILSIRVKTTLSPHSTVRLCFISGFAKSREDALLLIDRYHDPYSFEREDEMSWTQSQAELRHLSINFDQASIFQQLGSHLLFPCGPMRAPPLVDRPKLQSQSALWRYGISGDRPIVYMIIKNSRGLSLARQLLLAHEYFRYKGINFDLVILNTQVSTYRLELQDEILQQVRMTGQQALLNKDGGVFVLKKDVLPLKDALLLQTIARVFIDINDINLKELVTRHDHAKFIIKVKSLEKKSVTQTYQCLPLIPPKRLFENGYGGFSMDGREYIIFLDSKTSTPAPWCNVIANENDFGFLISELGSTYSWSKNSRENRISPWSNDSVSDPSGERLLVVDNDSGSLWSPTPNLNKGPEPYQIRHGQGYSQFENNNFGLSQKLTILCSVDDEVKQSLLVLRNDSPVVRKLCVVYYIELVLGSDRAMTSQHIRTDQVLDKNVLLARNPFSEDFGERVTFVATSEHISSFTCERKSFLNLFNEKAKNTHNTIRLDGQIGGGLDPCIAVCIDVELAPNQSKELTFLLGQSYSEEAALSMVDHFFVRQKKSSELDRVKKYWDGILTKIQVKTNFAEFDILVNSWLLYQNLSCRVWGRSAFYQSGGAFGFRDQLQDILSLLHTAPDIAKRHILLAAAHQFVEGDVQHWWHPPSNKGVRTHFSDDLLWLPYATSIFINTVDDWSLLEEIIPFLDGPSLSAEQEDLYFQPTLSDHSGTLYEHCLRAIDRSLEVGEHGFPLIGSGDWNDGMNLVGENGKGESVWMAWFLITILKSFTEICKEKGDLERAKKYSDHIKKLSQALEFSGWDGNWYKRAFFDDGTPLGSKENDECMIDSLTQSWAALSGQADPEHLKKSMDSLLEHLVDNNNKLVLLFKPPFNHTILNPGYIKGYLPGIRENGGQYTHAAIWAAMAFAALNDGENAFKLISMLNPINHSLNKIEAKRYIVEPYVVSADIYANSSHLGRGGWTWYTGSAGWFYRACTESILGLSLHGSKLTINPCLSSSLSEYQLEYKFGASLYKIDVTREGKSKATMTIDGIADETLTISLVDDGRVHQIEIVV